MCDDGKIRRRSYTRRDGVYVRSACVKDMGLPGKTPAAKRVLPKLTPGRLSRYGYVSTKSATHRRAALRKAVNAEGYATIIRRLVAVSNYNSRSAPEAHRVMRSDIEWMKVTLK
jgi:hypothetical protein